MEDKENEAPTKEEQSKPISTNESAKNLDNEKTVKLSRFSNDLNAGPAVRKYARELDIDLTKIKGSGNNNRITKEDLKEFIHSNKSNGLNLFEISEGELSKYGSYRIEELSKIQKIGSKNLHQSWISIPHVTHFEEIELSFYEKKYKSKKVSLLSFLTKIVALALKEHEVFNSSLLRNDQIMIKEYINIGIAVNTESGLVVPVIKDVINLSLNDINESIINIAEKARSKKLRENDLKGATFSISSLGKVGGTGFTPIINPPEVAIMSVSRSTSRVSLDNKNNVVEKSFLPIALSYDHRVINGVDAGNFLYSIKMIAEGKHDEISSI